VLTTARTLIDDGFPRDSGRSADFAAVFAIGTPIAFKSRLTLCARSKQYSVQAFRPQTI
jgi:hypothetical protein